MEGLLWIVNGTVHFEIYLLNAHRNVWPIVKILFKKRFALETHDLCQTRAQLIVQ